MDNHHADALFQIPKGYRTVEDDEDEIPWFILEGLEDEPYFAELDLTATLHFIKNDYAEIDQLLEMEDKKDSRFENISMEELFSSQHNDAFYSEINLRLNEGEKLSFKYDDDGLLVCTTHTDAQIVVSHSLEKHVLCINYYPILAVHPGGHKLYHRIRRHFYWPALAGDC